MIDVSDVTRALAKLKISRLMDGCGKKVEKDGKDMNIQFLQYSCNHSARG